MRWDSNGRSGLDRDRSNDRGGAAQTLARVGRYARSAHLRSKPVPRLTSVILVAASTLLFAAAGASNAQPLKQNFAFGAPPGVLGNDRVLGTRYPRLGRVRPPGTDVRVRFGERNPARRRPGWRAE